MIPPPSTSTRASRPGQTRSTAAVELAHDADPLALGIEQTAPRRPRPAPTRRRSRRRPPCRRRARPAGTRRRSTSRPCSRSRRSSRVRRARSPTRTGSDPSAIARGSSSVRQRSARSGSPAATSASRPTKSPLSSFDGEAEPRLERRVLGRDVRPPHPVALLEPQRVDRLVAARDEPVLAPGLPDRVPERQPELRGTVELPAELADVRHAQREARHAPDGELARAHVRERLVREIRRRQRLQDLARLRSPDAEAGVLGGLVRHLDGAVVRERAA